MCMLRATVRRRNRTKHILAMVTSVTVLALGAGLPAGAAARDATWWFNPGPGRDTEVSLAVDPKDARRVLVVWQEDASRIWTARTGDRGRSWQVEVLHDPATLPGTDREGFDPTAAIGPDGSMYVLMGVPAVPGGITLVRRDPRGWSFHRVDNKAGEAHGWDAMHLAVAPDSGELYVVAQSGNHRGIGFWQSSDRGDSWTTVRFPHLENASNATPLREDGAEYWPRVAAGPNGLVLLVTKALFGQLRATASVDHGSTFGPLTSLTERPLHNFIGVPAAFDGSVAVAAYVTDSQFTVLRSARGTAPWRSARFPRKSAGYVTDWSTVAVDKGTVWILHTEAAQPRGWRVLLTRIRGQSVKTATLEQLPAQRPRGTGAGDEYGGLRIARDGCVWAAWSEPTPGGGPAIAVTTRC